MALFNLENDFDNALKMEGPMSKGPAMRWQRKLNESNVNSSNLTANSSLLQVSSLSFTKSPSRRLRRSSSLNSLPSKENNSNKSTPLRRSRTPGRSKTPSRSANSSVCSGDRFIPNRFASDFESAQHRVSRVMKGDSQPEPGSVSIQQQEYKQAVAASLTDDDPNRPNKILRFQRTAAPSAPEGPPAPDCHMANLKVLYSQHKTPITSSKKSSRHIPSAPERILDAPDLLNDYYLNLISWSVTNLLAVPLGSRIYIWNAETGDISQLMEVEEPDYISSTSWVADGNYLAVGISTGDVQIWDVTASRRLRSMSGHDSRVGSLSWNSHVVSSGCRDGAIHHHDVRVAQHLIGQASGHSQEVCGLQWSPDGRYLASGGNDNVLNIWSNQYSSQPQEPVYALSQHLAAVKALAWCPWQSSTLASGGGTADRCIKFWNCNTGVCLSSVDTKSQVCSLLWAKEHRELISSHGFPDNNLSIWKYPEMTKVTDLTGHTGRVLHMAMSPDATTVVSAAADETLRMWKCFAIDPAKAKKAAAKSKTAGGLLSRGIR